MNLPLYGFYCHAYDFVKKYCLHYGNSMYHFNYPLISRYNVPHLTGRNGVHEVRP